ncbi:hypothetical protein [Candidatus Uabimicrobium sp. HlEnr_7]|uniref:hypothetical protein n=1 Tax=Candidatus Uabimicrobium helgolandensis TaxID=3095367 RepID=UPI0035592843
MSTRLNISLRVNNLKSSNLLQKMDILYNTRFTVNTNDSGEKQYQKLVFAVRKRMRKNFSLMEQALQVIDNSNIVVRFLHPISDYHCYLFSLLKVCSKKHDLSLEEVQRLEPIEIEIIDKSIVVYSLRRANFDKSCHKKPWRLAKSKMKYHTIYDYSSFVAEIYVDYCLNYFAKQHCDLMPYLVAKNCVIVHQNRIKVNLPVDSDFAHDLKKVISRYWGNEVIQNYTRNINKYKNVFYARVLNNFDKWFVTKEIIRHLQYVKVKKRVEDDRSTYARVFETKKNIRKKTLAVMKDNAFLNFYGYVELDNSTDLEYFSVLEKHLMELHNYFTLPVAVDHSLRVKKLGKHKADGLYFPSEKATIFAIDHPESFAHELAHQIDYTHGEQKSLLSETASFRHVVDLYIDLVTAQIQNLPANSTLRKRWFSRHKYNCDYYCQNTEIFARAFEIFLYHENIRSPLVECHFRDKSLYPHDPYFVSTIREYIYSSVCPLISLQ